ncbi:MAG: S1 RNA-binding domain-containing protein [Anaerolineae bacterium]
MTVSGEVTFKVKQFIAARERFTIGQVAKLTGLKHKSVETVVQRLVRDGYVVKSQETVPVAGRGRRPLYYTLTADMEKRKELVNEVSAFQPRAVPVRVHPLSANYIGAHDMLDELEREPDVPDHEARLVKIEKHLELAAFEEGLEDREEGTAVVRAYLLRERARVAALRHQWVEAGRLLREAHLVFEEHGLEGEVEKTDQYWFTLLIRQRLMLAKDGDEIARVWQEIPHIVQEMGLAANPVVQLTVAVSKVLSFLIIALGSEVRETANRLWELVPLCIGMKVDRRGLEEEARFTLDREDVKRKLQKDVSIYLGEGLPKEVHHYTSFQWSDILEGVVVSTSPTEILIDLGSKAASLLSSRELGRTGLEAVERLKVGDEVPVSVYILVPEDKVGQDGRSEVTAREWRKQQKEKLLSELQEGDIRRGRVSSLCNFGAFIDLDGTPGLVHLSELSWKRVSHPKEVLQVGDEVDVYVLKADREKGHIGLSIKRLEPKPSNRDAQAEGVREVSR